MTHNNDRWMDQTGLNVIRIVIGSYFLAASLDLVSGVDQTALFAFFLGFQAADLIGSTLLFAISVCFMVGISLRYTALLLAVFVLVSSIIQNFVVFEPGNVSDFWRDVTLAAAVILSYSSLGRREMRKASVLARRSRTRRILGQKGVAPRRVTLEKIAKRPVQRDIRNALFSPNALASKEQAYSEDDCDNLFANV